MREENNEHKEKYNDQDRKDNILIYMKIYEKLR